MPQHKCLLNLYKLKKVNKNCTRFSHTHSHMKYQPNKAIRCQNGQFGSCQ